MYIIKLRDWIGGPVFNAGWNDEVYTVDEAVHYRTFKDANDSLVFLSAGATILSMEAAKHLEKLGRNVCHDSE